MLLALAVAASPATAQAPPVVDQEFVAETSAGAAINECCRFVAQTFTAGRSARLAAVNVDVVEARAGRLRVELRTVAGGIPTANVLGATVLPSGGAPFTQLIVFPQRIIMTAGNQYAIVLSYEGAPPPGPGQTQGIWAGAAGDGYPLGDAFASQSDGVTWSASLGVDLHFRTHLCLEDARPDETKVCQAITFAPLSPRTFGDRPFAVTASASSSLPTSFDATGSCRIVPAAVSLVVLTGPGSCTVTAHQPGNETYAAAPDASQTFSIAPAPCTVPAVVGKSLTAAKAALPRRHCRLGRVTRVRSAKRRGTVVAQRPRAGRILPSGAKVNLAVSRGPR